MISMCGMKKVIKGILLKVLVLLVLGFYLLDSTVPVPSDVLLCFYPFLMSVGLSDLP